MKKLLVSIIVFAMMLSMLAVGTSAAPAGCTAIDVTDQVKFMSVVDMYKSGTPIIRDDARFVYSSEFDPATSVGKDPGKGTRTIEITDFDEEAYKDQLQFDQHYFDDGMFAYPCIWQNNAEDGATAKGVYKFTVETAGTYEIVVLGCGQIKAENVGNDAKDRGFSYSIDGGQKYQVNISDTPLIFREYSYVYSMEDASKDLADGKYTYYQIGCVYNIKVELTAGEHTFEFGHLEYSGETVLNTGNGPRLNFAGFYYQKYLDDAALAAYKYPKAPEETTTPEVTTTKAPVTTPKPAVTTVPDATTTPTASTTAAASTSGGCGSVVSGVAVIIAFAGAAFVVSKKH